MPSCFKKKIIGVLACLPMVSYASPSREAEWICNAVSKSFEELQQQLPLNVDYGTTLMGVQNIYLNGVCTVNYSYEINADLIIQEMINEGLTYQESVSLLSSAEGKETFKSSFQQLAKNNVDTNMATFKKYRNTQISFYYTWSNPSIRPIRVLGLDTTT